MRTVESLEELIKVTADVFNGEIEIDNVVIDESFKCIIELKGNDFDGYVDYRVAKFITSLERNRRKAIKRLASNLSLHVDKEVLKSLAIKAHVTDGSTNVELALDRLEEVLLKMKSEHLLLLFVFICATYLGYSHIQASRDIQMHAKTKDAEIAIAENTKEVLEVATEYQQPMLDLIGSMRSGDTITLPEVGRPLSKKEAEEFFPKVDEAIPETYYIDDTYEITDISLTAMSVKIRKPGMKSFRVDTKFLNQSDRELLSEAVKDAVQEESTAVMDLQVSASIAAREETFVVTGLGPKRDGSISIQELRSKHPALPEGGPKQASLLD